ncbi:pectinesterase inhibitor 9-like [Rutidosis leptorrhynchoides]|uniref:pectinesterase inhibitor 9-like n=1 Tax=Rutidosis leptorrhynchoides TaxID=125765 RepID=UPI003A9A230A
MAHLFLSFLILSFTIFGFSAVVESRSRARMYLDSQCKSTRYPNVCVQTLLPYVNKRGQPSSQLQAQISLASCLSKARFVKTYMNIVANKLNKRSSFGSYKEIKECLHQINDGVKQISQSFKELQQMGKDGYENFVWHESNVQTWISTALTDATSCVDGIRGDGISDTDKAVIQAKILNVKQLASNSLALFTRFTAKYRAAHGIRVP